MELYAVPGIEGMKSAVFGAYGFLGGNLLPHLVQAGHKICIFTSNTQGPEQIPGSPDIIRGRLGDAYKHKAMLAECDNLFLYAATSVPGKHDASPIKEIQEDVLQYGHLFEAVRNLPIKRVIYLSSGGTIYGIPQKQHSRTRAELSYFTIPEDHPLEPISSYGMGKLFIEKLIRRYEPLSKWKYTILRPANPVGLAQLKKLGTHGLIATMMYKLKRGKKIEIWGSGSTTRDYFDVDDLSRAVISTLGTDRTANEIYNVGSGEGHSIDAIVKLAEEIANQKVLIEKKPEWHMHTPYNVLNIEKLTEHTGWKPEIPLRQTMMKLWEELP